MAASRPAGTWLRCLIFPSSRRGQFGCQRRRFSQVIGHGEALYGKAFLMMGIQLGPASGSCLP